jgi:hypothetical protein
MSAEVSLHTMPNRSEVSPSLFAPLEPLCPKCAQQDVTGRNRTSQVCTLAVWVPMQVKPGICRPRQVNVRPSANRRPSPHQKASGYPRHRKRALLDA